MKKLVMFALCAVIGSVAWAGDIYAIKMIAKVPVIKEASTFYKDYKATTYNGYIDVNYDESGAVINPCAAVIYGEFAEGKATKDAEFNFDVFDVYGKGTNKLEMSLGCEVGSITATLNGLGKCKVVKSKPTDSCGDDVECLTAIYLDTANGEFTGLITDVVCDPCGGASWTWNFLTCLENLEFPGTVDVISGTWSLRYNKGLSEDCQEAGFPECVYSKIPKGYPVAE